MERVETERLVLRTLEWTRSERHDLAPQPRVRDSGHPHASIGNRQSVVQTPFERPAHCRKLVAPENTREVEE